MAPIGMQKMVDIVNKHHDGATINLFVTSGSQETIFPAGFNKWRNCIEIKVQSPPKNNMANKEVIKTISEFLDIPINSVLIISGNKKRKKIVLIKDKSVDIISQKLTESFDGL